MPPPLTETSRRKQDHLDLCLNHNVESRESSSWDSIQLPHRALPEINFNDINLSTTFFKRKYAAPYLISSMTGGSPQGEELNLRLARFAEEKNIPMGVGSQRVALENREYGFFSRLRKEAPTVTLFANIGAVQLNYGVSADDCQWLIDSLEAQAFTLHCNPLQEAIQREGNRDFSNLFRKIEQIKKSLTVPLILKETGCGIDPVTAQKAMDAGVDAIDIAGRGGSHWGFIEGLRSPERRELGVLFRNWGNESAQATRDCLRIVNKRIPVIASGGIRSGLDASKALYLGATLCGMALPFIRAAEQGEEVLNTFWNTQTEALKIALFCMGCKEVYALPQEDPISRSNPQ